MSPALLLIYAWPVRMRIRLQSRYLFSAHFLPKELIFMGLGVDNSAWTLEQVLISN